MPDNKRHHYVPQFYLKAFGLRNSVAVFNLARRQHYRHASISGQCQRDYLYGKDGRVEKMLARIEGAASRAVRSVLDTSALPGADEDAYFGLINFIAFQHGRTPAAGAKMDAMAGKIARAILKSPGVGAG